MNGNKIIFNEIIIKKIIPPSLVAIGMFLMLEVLDEGIFLNFHEPETLRNLYVAITTSILSEFIVKYRKKA